MGQMAFSCLSRPLLFSPFLHLSPSAPLAPPPRASSCSPVPLSHHTHLFSMPPDTGPGSIPSHRRINVCWYISSTSSRFPLSLGTAAIFARRLPMDMPPWTLKNEVTLATSSFAETSLPSNLHWQCVRFGWQTIVAQSLCPVDGLIMHWYNGSRTISTPGCHGDVTAWSATSVLEVGEHALASIPTPSINVFRG